MNNARKRRLEERVDEILDRLRAIQKSDSIEAAVDALQNAARDPVDLEFALKYAKKRLQFEEFNELEPNTLPVLLGLLRSQKIRKLLIDGIPSDRMSIVETQLKKIQDELIPSMGQELMDAGNELIRKRPGRQTKIPSEEICRQICRFISDLSSDQKVGRVDAREASGVEV